MIGGAWVVGGILALIAFLWYTGTLNSLTHNPQAQNVTDQASGITRTLTSTYSNPSFNLPGWAWILIGLGFLFLWAKR